MPSQPNPVCPLVVDDEAPALRRICDLLAKDSDIATTLSAENGLAAIAMIQDARPDIWHGLSNRRLQYDATARRYSKPTHARLRETWPKSGQASAHRPENGIAEDARSECGANARQSQLRPRERLLAARRSVSGRGRNGFVPVPGDAFLVADRHDALQHVSRLV